MVKAALAKLQHRCERLTSILAFGTATEISAARELLRQSLVELYQPDQFKRHMRLFRASSSDQFSVSVSMSAPDRRGRYIP
jgi:hypothetical protein